MSATPSAPSGDTNTGTMLRALRQLAGMQLEDVARKADVSAAHLARVEAGHAPSSPRWTSAVANAIAEQLRDHADRPQSGH